MEEATATVMFISSLPCAHLMSKDLLLTGDSSSEEKLSIPFFDLIFNRDVNRRSANTWSGSSLGSEFLGKRRKRVSEFLGKRAPGSEFLGKRVPGSEFLGKRVPGSEFLGKRVPGSEFLGKRVPGSEFLGKRVPGSEFLGKRVPGSEFLGKRVPGSEFLGKRVPGSEFLGKRRYNALSMADKRVPEVPSEVRQRSDRERYWDEIREALLHQHPAS